MPDAFLCDGGCGTAVTEETTLTALGNLVVKRYCPDCAPHVDAYLKARDALHDRAAKTWADGLRTLRAKALKKLGEDGELPA